MKCHDESVKPISNRYIIKSKNGYTIENPEIIDNIIYIDCIPESPVEKHYCKSKSGDWLCKTNLNESHGLILVDYRGIWEKVNFCPFCGEKA